MALIKFGGGVAAASGKIDGTVYSRNRSGAIARGWTKPNNPRTATQEATRSRFTMVASTWSGLTLDQQVDWNSLASTVTRKNRLGETYVPTGRQIFMEVNNAMAAAGQELETTAPANLNPPIVGETTPIAQVENDAGILTVMMLNSLGAAADCQMIIDATPALTAPRNNVANLYRNIATVPNSGSVDVLTGWTAIYGTFAAVGNFIYFRVRNLSETNGIFSSPQIIVGEIVAATP